MLGRRSFLPVCVAIHVSKASLRNPCVLLNSIGIILFARGKSHVQGKYPTARKGKKGKKGKRKERKGKERKGKERKGKERKGKERPV